MPISTPTTPTVDETAVPSPPAGPSLPVISGATGTSASGITPPAISPFSGGVLSAASLNQLLSYVNLAARAGAGAGVMDGLGLSQTSGLVLNIAAGTAMVGAPVRLEASTYTVPASQSTIFIWLKSDGTLTHTLSSTPPSGTVLNLGWCASSGSAITSIDQSGIMRIVDGVRYRVLAGYGKPSDSPSSSTAFFHFNQGGAWFWSGTRYIPLGGPCKDAISITLSDANATLTDAQSRAEVIELSGTLTATRTITIAPIPRGQWTFINGTGQSLTFKTSTGASITVAAGKTAILRLDSAGLDMKRVTADV